LGQVNVAACQTGVWCFQQNHGPHMLGGGWGSVGSGLNFHLHSDKIWGMEGGLLNEVVQNIIFQPNETEGPQIFFQGRGNTLEKVSVAGINLFEWPSVEVMLNFEATNFQHVYSLFF